MCLGMRGRNSSTSRRTNLNVDRIVRRKKEIEAFFALVRVGLWSNANVDINLDFDGVDWGEVYQLAEEQAVVGLVAAGMEKLNDNHNVNIPLELKLQIIGEALQIDQQNKEMNAFIADTIEKMRQADIYTLLVKGQGTAQCYEKPLWRCSGDVDLFLSESNYERAKLLLQPMASHVDEEGISAKHLGMTIDGFVVELHGTLHGGLSSKVDKELDDVLNDTFHGGNVRS